MTYTIEYDRHGLAGVWSDTDEDIFDKLGYITGNEPPRFPMPAMQLRTKYDWSDLRAGRIVGLMLGCFTRHCLLEYWPHEYE